MSRKIKKPLNLDDLPESVKEHILQLERMRSDFVANVSHELRTPLTVIRGYLETLIGKKKASPISQEIFVQMLQHSARMEHIVEDLLLLSRLESEDHPLEEKQSISIGMLLQALRDDAQRVSGKRQHYITLEADPSVLIDGSEEELKSLFSNIIINAVKYTPERGSVTIRWYQANGQAIFSVSDTGIGIAKSHIPRLTERFYRVDKARSRDSGGTGLGLAIAKHVLMGHQAELAIESRSGKGSTFTCTFPAARTTVIKLSQ